MSKIPRPSPRTFRELPLSDDAKRAALLKTQENTGGKPKEENKSDTKQLKKVAISNAALPPTLKESAVSSRAAMNRQCKTMSRSKTEPDIKLEYVSSRGNGRITTKEKQPVNLKPAVHATKKDEVPKSFAKKDEVLKGVVRLKQRLSFREKKPTKFQEPEQEQSLSNSKTTTKTGNGDITQLALKTKTPETSKPTYQLPKDQKKKLNRSKTESAINIGNVNKGTETNKTSKLKAQFNALNKGKDKQVKATTLGKRENMLPEKKDNSKDVIQLQAKFTSPRDIPHSGIKFAGKPRKKAMSFNFKLNRIPCPTSNEDCDSSAAPPKNERQEM